MITTVQIHNSSKMDSETFENHYRELVDAIREGDNMLLSAEFNLTDSRYLGCPVLAKYTFAQGDSSELLAKVLEVIADMTLGMRIDSGAETFTIWVLY